MRLCRTPENSKEGEAVNKSKGRKRLIILLILAAVLLAAAVGAWIYLSDIVFFSGGPLLVLWL